MASLSGHCTHDPAHPSCPSHRWPSLSFTQPRALLNFACSKLHRQASATKQRGAQPSPRQAQCSAVLAAKVKGGSMGNVGAPRKRKDDKVKSLANDALAQVPAAAVVATHNRSRHTQYCDYFCERLCVATITILMTTVMHVPRQHHSHGRRVVLARFGHWTQPQSRVDRVGTAGRACGPHNWSAQQASARAPPATKRAVQVDDMLALRQRARTTDAHLALVGPPNVEPHTACTRPHQSAQHVPHRSIRAVAPLFVQLAKGVHSITVCLRAHPGTISIRCVRQLTCL